MDDEKLVEKAVEKVWVKLRDHDPAPGLAVRWTERHGLRWADVTYELNGRFRAERLPLMALRKRAHDGEQS